VDPLQGRPITAIAGVPFSGVVVTLSATSATSLSSIIHWGDGHTSPGTIKSEGHATFEISGTNTYSQSGSYSLLITLASPAGSTQTATTTALVTAFSSSHGAVPTTATAFASSSSPVSALGSSGSLTSVTAGFSISGTGSIVVDAGAVPMAVVGVPQLNPPQPAAGLLVPLQPQAPPPILAPMLSLPPIGQPATVSTTEQVPWANLHEQQPNPVSSSAATPVLARGVAPPTESAPAASALARGMAPPTPLQGLFVFLVSSHGDLQDLRNSPISEPPGAVQPALAEQGNPVAFPSEPSQDAGPAVYFRPLHQVADRSELTGFPAGLPDRLAQALPGGGITVAPSLLPPPLPLERGRRVADGAEAAGALGSPSPPTLQTVREGSTKGGSLFFRPLRTWLLAITACVLQALHFCIFRPSRRRALALDPSKGLGQ